MEPGTRNGDSPRLSIIVAMARNGVIGARGSIPWHLPDELKRFRNITMGHHIIMGRKTWESIGRPLSGRTSVVVTRQAGYSAPGAIVAHSLDNAIQACRGDVRVAQTAKEPDHRRSAFLSRSSLSEAPSSTRRRSRTRTASTSPS